MPSRAALTWAGATGAAIAAAGVGVLYYAHPSLPWRAARPVAAIEPAAKPGPTAPAAPQAAAAAAPSPVEPAAAPAAQQPAAAAPAAAPVRPSFDVVSVEPGGETVVAGRAAPNVKVALLDDGRRLAEATSNAQGQFVMIPEALPPGDHSLTLSAGAGAAILTSPAVPVSVAAPPPPPPMAAAPSATPASPVAPPPPPTAAAAPAEAAAPSATAVSPVTPPPAAPAVAIRSIEAGAGGGMVAQGVAAPNATVRLYVSGAYVGDARTKDDGRWSLTIERGLTPGDYDVRADEIAEGGQKVVARAEAPFAFPAALAAKQPEAAAAAAPSVATPAPSAAAPSVVAPSPSAASPPVLAASAPAAAVAPAAPSPPSPSDVVVAAVQTHTVERGHTLWGISQKFYGDGSRYVVIFSANAGQIRNPNLIYPGQVFVVPKGELKP